MKNLKELSDEELVDLFKKHNYCFENMSRSEDFDVSRETIRREFIKREIDYYKIIDNWKNSLKETYNQSPKLCEYCGKPIPWEKRLKNNYCSSSCAAFVTNKVMDKTNWQDHFKHLRKSDYEKAQNDKARKYNSIRKKYSEYNIAEVKP